MPIWDESDKLIILRVNARKYNMVKAYIDQNKYRTWPALSFGKIFDDALDALIKEKHITEPSPIKGQCKIDLWQCWSDVYTFSKMYIHTFDSDS